MHSSDSTRFSARASVQTDFIVRDNPSEEVMSNFFFFLPFSVELASKLPAAADALAPGTGLLASPSDGVASKYCFENFATRGCTDEEPKVEISCSKYRLNSRVGTLVLGISSNIDFERHWLLLDELEVEV